MKNIFVLFIIASTYCNLTIAQPQWKWPNGTVCVNNQLIQTITNSGAQNNSKYPYNTVSYYVVAHQDDWQLFMGYQVWYDVRSYDETMSTPNGTKVVFIYVTDGAFQTKHCSNTYNEINASYRNPVTGAPALYSEIREEGAMNSIHLTASSNKKSASSVAPYPATTHSGDSGVYFNGHSVAVNKYKNTVSYFLRINTFGVDSWYNDFAYQWWGGESNDTACPLHNINCKAWSVDGDVFYGYSDLVATIAAIYNYETNTAGDVVPGCIPWVNMQDPNPNINICDNREHTAAGLAAFDAAVQYSNNMPGAPTIPINLWEDYMTGGSVCNIAASPVNLCLVDIQNKSAEFAAYERALIKYQIYYEYDGFSNFYSRSYNRITNTVNGW